MNFLTPAAFILSLLIPLIIAMYLLKLRRTEQVIASVYLWRRMVRDIEANAPWQRLRRNLLLLLQLLVVAMLILALARPFTWTEGVGGMTAIFVVDTSASMAAVDGSPTRLADAKRQLHALIDGLPGGASATLIEAGETVRVVASSSQDRRLLHTAADSLQLGAGGSNMAAALELAAAVAARQPDAEIVVLSDFAGDPPVGPMRTDARIHPIPIGQRSDNAAISALSLRSLGDGASAFVQVANYGAEPMQRRLVLSIGTTTAANTVMEVFAAYDLSIPAHGQEVVVVDNLPGTTTSIEATLAGDDALPLDDRAWSVRPNAAPAPVTLVTNGNRFLETALALMPHLEVTVVRPQDYTGGDTGTTALTILDAVSPEVQPSGNLLYMGPPRGNETFTITGAIELPQLQAVDPGDPLLAHVNLREIGVLQAAHIPLPVWARAHIVDGAGSEAAPLLLSGEQGGRRLAVLAFDLRQSDLPLHVAFPLLLNNLIEWLAASSGVHIPDQVAPGAAISFAPPQAVESVTITHPDGHNSQLLPENGRFHFSDTTVPGLYTIAWDGVVQSRFAVNLAAPQESTVAPGTPASIGQAPEGEGGSGSLLARQEWWRWLAFLALALLVAEWMVYQRASLVRLWSTVRSRATTTPM